MIYFWARVVHALAYTFAVPWVRTLSFAVAFFAQAVKVGPMIFVSGQLGMRDGALVEGGVSGQTTQAVANLAERLAAMGASLTDVVKTTCFLIDMDTFATFNAAYMDRFGDHRPARSTIAVRELPAGGHVEIEAVAFKPV